MLTFPVLIGGSLGLSILLGDHASAFPALAQPLAPPIALVWIFFLGGPLQEEFGWRGYVFESLRDKMSAIYAAILAGALWGLWHLPLFFVPREEFYYNRPVWGLLLTTILVGIILAWFYANTNGSVFAAMLGHAMFNWSNYVFPALGSDSAALILFVGYFLLAAFIIWQFGPKTLTRGRGASQSSLEHGSQVAFGRFSCRDSKDVAGRPCDGSTREREIPDLLAIQPNNIAAVLETSDRDTQCHRLQDLNSVLAKRGLRVQFDIDPALGVWIGDDPCRLMARVGKLTDDLQHHLDWGAFELQDLCALDVYGIMRLGPSRKVGHRGLPGARGRPQPHANDQHPFDQVHVTLLRPCWWSSSEV